MATVTELLERDASSLEEVRALAGEISKAGPSQQPDAIPGTPKFYTSDEVQQWGVTIPTGWMVKISPDEGLPGEYAVTYINPQGWEMDQNKTWKSPDGKVYTQDQLQELEKQPKGKSELEQIYGRVFPSDEEINFNEALKWISASDTNRQTFIESIRHVGRNPDTEALLKGLFPTITDMDLSQLFAPQQAAPQEEISVMGQFWNNLKSGVSNLINTSQSPAIQNIDFWKRIVIHIVPFGQALLPESREMAGSVIAIPTTVLNTFIDRPWEVAIIEAQKLAAYNPINKQAGPSGADLEAIKQIDGAFEKYGWMAIFSNEVSTAFDQRMKAATGYEKFALTVAEYGNPVYMIPIGGTFGAMAKFTSKVPVIGKVAQVAAAAARAAEAGMAAPFEIGGIALSETAKVAGSKMGEKLMAGILKKSPNLITEFNFDIDKIVNGVLVDNWQRRAVKTLSALPGGKAGIEKTLGTRILADKESKVIEDIVGRGAVGHAEISRMGLNARNAKVMELRAISGDPVKMFGFNKNVFSRDMYNRLLPQYAEHRGAAGTLEHVFTHPEMYSLTLKQVDYITRVNELNSWVLNMLKREGVAPEHFVDDWVHRVVVDIDRQGPKLRKGRAVGAKPSYEKTRKFETMAEGIEWFLKHPELGKMYSNNPENLVGEYISQAFKKIADNRLELYVEKFGITPKELLEKRFPGLAAEAERTAKELGEAANFVMIMNRGMRNENLPGGTLAMVRRQFPQFSSRLDKALSIPVPSFEKAINTISEEFWKTTKISKKEFMDTLDMVRMERAGKQPLTRFIKLPDGKYIDKYVATIDELGIIPNSLGPVYQYAKSKGMTDASFKKLSIVEIMEGIEINEFRQFAHIPKTISSADYLIGTYESWNKLNILFENDVLKNIPVWKKQGVIPEFISIDKEVIQPDELTATLSRLNADNKTTADMLSKIYTGNYKLASEEQQALLRQLQAEAKNLVEIRKGPYWRVKNLKAEEMRKILESPGLGLGRIMQPFASGKIYEQEFIDAFNKFFGYEPGSGTLKMIADANGILRVTKASLDFSSMAIQGMPSFGLAHSYILTNPKIGLKMMGAWYKAFGYSVAAFFDPEVLSKAMVKNAASIDQRIGFGGSSRAIDYTVGSLAEGGLGGFTKKMLDKIPLKPFERAEYSFYAGGELVRDEFWKILSPKAIKQGKEFELARQLDLLTGITDSKAMGVPLTSRQFESSFAWFAPNYTRASLTSLGDIFRGGYTGAMAKKAIGGMIGAGAVYFAATQYGMASLEGKTHEQAWNSVMEGFGIKTDPITGEPTWAPSANFMAIKVGNYNFGFGGFWYGMLRLSGNIMDTIAENGDAERVDLIKILKNGSLNKDNPFIYWWYTRSAPIVGTGFELFGGRDFLGYPMETPRDYVQYIISRFEPIWMEQGLNWMIPGYARDNEVPQGAAKPILPLAEIFGMRSFPDSSWSKFYDKADEYIKRIPQDELDAKQIEAFKAGKLTWSQLTDMQKQNLIQRYPDLKALYDGAQGDSAVRDSSQWAGYTARTDAESKIYHDRLNELDKQLKSGAIDMKTYREKVSEAGMNYGAVMEALSRDPAYADLFTYFDNKEDKYGFRDDIAMAEYQSQILYAEDLTDAKGDYDYRERDKRIADFIAKWGQDEYDKVQAYENQHKKELGYSDIQIRKSEDNGKLGLGYWKLPYQSIKDMTAEDMANGDIPAQYVDAWKQYQALTDKQAKADFLKVHTELTQDFRADYRKTHPEDDARLALWGYGGKVQTIEAYNLVKKWSSELGIPMKLTGLPPDNLVQNYFEYNAIVAQSGGSSSQAKNYRKNNPGWDAWGVDNLGWSPISTQTVNPPKESVAAPEPVPKPPTTPAKQTAPPKPPAKKKVPTKPKTMPEKASEAYAVKEFISNVKI